MATVEPRKDLAQKLSREAQVMLQQQLRDFCRDASCGFEYVPWIEPPPVEAGGDPDSESLHRSAREQLIGPEIHFKFAVIVPAGRGTTEKVEAVVWVPFYRWIMDSEDDLRMRMSANVCKLACRARTKAKQDGPEEGRAEGG